MYIEIHNNKNKVPKNVMYTETHLEFSILHNKCTPKLSLGLAAFKSSISDSFLNKVEKKQPPPDDGGCKQVYVLSETRS